MIEALLTEEQRKLRDEIRAFVRDDVPRQLVLDMDAGRVTYPRAFLEKAAARHLLGLRFPVEVGGRGLGWQDEIVALEEVGVLGTSLACLYSLPSIVGEALACFGTREQQARWLQPVLEGRLTVAEALTEPRGGSDFFGTTTAAERRGEDYYLQGQKRFIVGAEGADYFLVYARTQPSGEAHTSISMFVVERGPGVEVEHVYGLLGTRGGGTGRVTFRGARVPAREPGRQGERRGGDLLPDDDPGAHDQRRRRARAGARGAGGGRALQRPPQGIRAEDPHLRGGELQGRREHHAARCSRCPGPRHGRGRRSAR